MNQLLAIENLTIEYDNRVVLDNISMNLNNKEIISVVGESGSGKTTLIRKIICLLPANARTISGRINFNGKDLMDLKMEEWRNFRGNEISMIFQNPGSYLNPLLKIGKQFMETIQNHKSVSKAQAQIIARDTLKKMNFKEVDRIMTSYPFELSGGMKQRVSIAMAVAMHPKLILADEPTSALDVVTQVKIIDELMRLREKYDVSIIFVTHNIGLAAYIGDKILVMNQGQIVEAGSKFDIISNPQAEYTKKLLASVPELKGRDQ